MPLDLYLERYDLSTVLKTQASNASTARFGLFTYQLNLPSVLNTVVGFALPGSDGGMENKNGFTGGDIELFIEELMPSTAERLTFNG